jgi:type I restriction enzyme S subunit
VSEIDVLLENLDVISEAPGGIAELRSLVLVLALQGRLVRQTPAGEAGSELLNQIRANDLIKPARGLDLTTPVREPWEIPQSWAWARFGEITESRPGKTPPTKDPIMWAESDGHPWATIADMPDNGVLRSTNRAITPEAVQQCMKGPPAPVGTILMSFKLTLGKVCRLGIPCYFNEAIISVHSPFLETDEYLFRFLPVLAAGGRSKAAIMGKTLNASSLANMPIPLPPIDEQRKIVEVADELIALCDDLEARQGNRNRVSSELAVAAVAGLSSQ